MSVFGVSEMDFLFGSRFVEVDRSISISPLKLDGFETDTFCDENKMTVSLLGID